ncbi:MAG: outer membrane beta-barrel protein [Alphaproteobacteria bacterium]|jgi:opacity protein-like surface antigen|nr:outer membrane beta-barrel protein [Alphaproteobacteria bacterium]
MLKKTVALGSIVTALCGVTEANTGCHYKSGWLVGAHVGASFGKHDFTGTASAPGVSQTGKKSANKTAAVLGLFGGYRQIFNDGITLAAILEGNLYTTNNANATVRLFNTDFVNNAHRNYSFIPNIQIGKIFCSRYHVYLGLGLGISNIKTKASVPNTPFSVSASKTRVGFVPSVGFEYAATQNVSLLANVGYEIYGNSKKAFNLPNPPFAAGSGYAQSVKQNYWTVKIGAAYRF